MNKMTIGAALLAGCAAIPANIERKDAPTIEELLEQHREAVDKAIEGLEGKQASFGDELNGLAQKIARGGGRGGPEAPLSAGAQFVAADEVKGLIGNVRGGQRVSVQTKAVISSLTTDADGSAGDLVTPYRDQVYIPAKRRLTIRALLPTVQVSVGGSVEFAKRTGFTNNAATVAEGASKPSSEVKYDLVQLPLRTIAHWVLASRQVLDDAPQLAGLIDTDLRYGLAYVEEGQLLNGAGTGTDISGLYTQATSFAQGSAGGVIIASANKIDVIGAALLQNALADNPATGIVMHPSDWLDIRLTKNADGEYIMGPPGAAVEPRLFGLPVVPTPAMTVDKFLVGNFEAATLYDRWDARVEVSTEDSDNFRKNLVTVLAEERIGLAVKDATAFTKGDFSDAIAELAS